MGYSRVDKYKELRKGIKDEVGITHQNEIKEKIDEEPDDFLSFMKKDEASIENKDHHFEDTLTEAKTFEQMREEGSEELDKALKSVKENVGKEDRYNTRMDILNKIRDPEKQTIKLDSVAQYSTDEFSKGMFIHQEETDDLPQVEPEPKMTLLEKLAAISPKEDAKKAEAIIHEDNNEEDEEIEELEDIQEDDKEDTAEVNQYDFTDHLENDFEEDEDSSDRGNKIVTVLNYIIILLVLILIALLAMIVYQNFF